MHPPAESQPNSARQAMHSVLLPRNTICHLRSIYTSRLHDFSHTTKIETVFRHHASVSVLIRLK
jgi:hypothetical protein